MASNFHVEGSNQNTPASLGAAQGWEVVPVLTREVSHSKRLPWPRLPSAMWK